MLFTYLLYARSLDDLHVLFGTLRLHTQPCLTPKKSTTKSLRAFAAREGFEYGRVIVWATEEGKPRTLICEDCDQDGELILRLVVQKFLGTLKNPGEGPEERTVSGLRIVCLDSSDPAPELATKAILLRLFSSVSSEGLSSLVLQFFSRISSAWSILRQDPLSQGTIPGHTFP